MLFASISFAQIHPPPNTMKKSTAVLSNVLMPIVGALALTTGAPAATYFWTDWQTNQGGGVYTGQIVTGSATVGVTYTNTNGIAFFQNGITGNTTDYFAQGSSGSLGRNAATSPFTSAQVENIPTAAEMIALTFRGNQSLQFSEAIANPVFSYVSLNGNGYAFDQDFDILSFGAASDGNDIGYWGSGTSYKSVVDLGGGNFEYQLLGTGEPHGTIRFKGAFDTVSWRSLSSENWNGFTVGIEGTSNEVFRTPDGGQTLALLSLSLSGLVAFRKFRRN
jgi:hypothetical protein